MNGGDYNDANRDQEFESKRIDNSTPQNLNLLCGSLRPLRLICAERLLDAEIAEIRRERRDAQEPRERSLFYGIAGVNPCACPAGDIEKIRKALVL